MKASWQSIFKNRPFADRTLCHFLRQRLTLPNLQLERLLPGFDTQRVSITILPKGGWSTPLADVVMLMKLALCTQPQLMMEIGSFRGYTALMLAQHTSEDARIVTVDRYPDHGEAYRNTSFAQRIERRVGETNTAIFAHDRPQTYDLIFVDADHSYAGVKKDTELVLPLLAPDGYLVWHDYANWGFFNGYNGVPEFLDDLASESCLVARVAGTDLAIHCPAWSSAGQNRENYLAALTSRSAEQPGDDAWTSSAARG